MTNVARMVLGPVASTFLAVFAVCLVWAIGMPINAGPDEDQHLIWAASAARGQLAVDGPPENRTLAAPEPLFVAQCHQFRANTRTAACQDSHRGDPATDFRTRSLSTPPLYHVAVGLPSLLMTSWRTAYLIRLGHVFLVAAAFTIGLRSLSRLHRTPGSIVAVALVFTPMTVFMGGIVAPSGMAIATAFAVWAGGLALIRDDGTESALRAAMFGVPLVVFLLLRRDSVPWAALMITTLVFLAGTSRTIALSRSRPIRLWAAIGALAATVSFVGWGSEAASGFTTSEPVTYLGVSFSEAFGRVPALIEQMIGVLGWLDVRLPSVVPPLWYGMLMAVVFAAAAASRRHGHVIGWVAAITVVAPVVLGAMRYNYFQGRHGLPFALGIPLIASAALASESGRTFVHARIAKVIVWTVAALLSLSFAQALKRYSVTADNPWPELFTDPVWSPPLPTTAMVAIHVLVVGVIAWRVCRMIDDVEPARSVVSAR